MTIAFWFFLRQDSTGSFRTIFSKGNSHDEMEMVLQLWPNDRRLHWKLFPDAKTTVQVDSVGQLLMRRWTMISLTISSNSMSIFLNGRKDNTVTTNSDRGIVVGAPFFFGKDPWFPGVGCYIEELKIFSK